VQSTVILRIVNQILPHLTEKQKSFFNKSAVLNVENLLQMQIDELCSRQAPTQKRMDEIWQVK